MKVSIITRHAVPNYGSILQSYATQKTFEDLGYDAEILNYKRYDERGKESVLTNCHIGRDGIKNKLKRFLYFCVQYPNSQKMNNTFAEYRKRYLRLSNTAYGSLEELMENPPKADLYVTGSDQVWGKIGAEEIDPAYFLKYAPAGKPKIAYSASFGKTDLPKDLIDGMDDLLEGYSSLLLREKSAVELIEKYSTKTAEHILDPTLMLNADQWEELCEPTGLEGTEYIFVYQLHHNKDMENYISKLQKKTGLPVYRVHPSVFYALKPGNFVHLPSPGEFLSYIKHAKFVVTDSFHGTVFSTIFNRQYVDILPKLTGTRISSFLEMLGLEHRILTDLNDFGWTEQSIDYNKVLPILEQEKEHTLTALRRSLPKAVNTVAQMDQHRQCTGCSTCATVCPKNAITMTADDDGFSVPEINNALCVNCGICQKACPQLNPIKTEPFGQQGFAAKINDAQALSKSASGGVFFRCAQEILSQNGVVYGAAMDEDLTVIHCRIDSPLNLHRLQGSKYVQSDMGDTFCKVYDDLNNDRPVLFSGTPCQVAGLLAYLGKPYENLYTADIVCHGVPSQKLFRKSIEPDEKKAKSPMISYEFRNKEKRGWGKHFKKVFRNGKTRFGSGGLEAYYSTFLRGDICRECCYTCHYASMDRVGDLTLGDFWGIEKELPNFAADQGASCVIVNTPKGEKLFSQIMPDLVSCPVALDAIKKHNHNLTSPTPRRTKRNSMYLNIDQVPFKQMDIYRLHRFNFKEYVSYLIPRSMKLKIKKLLKR